MRKLNNTDMLDLITLLNPLIIEGLEDLNETIEEIETINNEKFELEEYNSLGKKLKLCLANLHHNNKCLILHLHKQLFSEKLKKNLVRYENFDEIKPDIFMWSNNNVSSFIIIKAI